MIDTELVRGHYARMSDEQLVRSAKYEAHNLEPEALEILHSEFRMRGLDIAVFDAIKEKETIAAQKTEGGAQHYSTELLNDMWAYAMDEKRNGKTDADIINGLAEKGLKEEDARTVTGLLREKSKELYDAHYNNMLRGGIICAIGIVVTVATYASSMNGGSYVVAWGAILFGGIRFFSGVANRETYKTILANIESERNGY